MRTDTKPHRVKTAITLLKQGRARNNRTFDTCFEMGDGYDIVIEVMAAAITDRVLREELKASGNWECWNTAEYRPDTLKLYKQRNPASFWDRTTTPKDYEIHISAEDTCPTCGAPLHLLVDMESATVDGERCPVDWDHIDNLFLEGIGWPDTKPVTT